MDPLLLSLVSACTALVAWVVGPMVTLTDAKRLAGNQRSTLKPARYETKPPQRETSLLNDGSLTGP
jgi:hypothetical protein